jgi:glycogen synthase
MALGRAEELYRQKDRLAAAQARCMAEDFGWARSVEEYLAVYRRVLAG